MIGKKLSERYELTAELGRGGMGVVYRARDPLLNREVAVKLIPPTLLSPETEERFRREAQLVAQMDHPSIVPIHDLGSHQESIFLVMPVVEGATLRAAIRGGELPLGDIIEMGIQVAEALDYSHTRGVVHRDVKPENIMLTRDAAGGLRSRVMDFGLARATTENRLTKTGTMVGTLSYFSPEQVSAKEIDSRSDIYSFGTVLYECVVGEPPFTGEVQSVLYRIMHEIPRSPRSLGAPIDDELEKLILSCLIKEPGQRPQKAGEIVERLRRYRSRLGEEEKAKSILMTRSVLIQRPALAPFVGRSKELGDLQERLNAAVDGECQFVVVGGEPGAGKTRLLDEIENLAHARKIRVLHGRFVEQDVSLPYQGFCDLIQESFRLKETPSSSGEPPDFSDLAADLISLFPMLTEISEIRSATSGTRPAPGTLQTTGAENRTQVYELLARTLTRIAGGRPLVLMLEDLHGAAVSIDALQYIVRRLGPTPTLLLGTYRTTEVDSRHPLTRMLRSFHGDRRFISLTLGPFSASEHKQFLKTLVGGPELSQDLVERLYEGTEGNPFFTKELVRSLIDSGGIARDDTGTWSLAGGTGISTDALPATIQQAVEKRIEGLPEELRDILSVAAVIGKSFDARDLETLARNKGEVDDAVDRLVEEGILEEERESRGDRLAFASGVVREVLYAGLSRRKRRSLHRKVAEQIESRHGGRLQRVYPQLVYHFSQGDVPEKTVKYALELAKLSLDAFSPAEAARSTRTALEFLDEEWEGDRAVEGEARWLLARAHRMSGDIDGALKEADAAIKIAESGDRQDRLVSLLLLAAETAWQARRIEDAGRRVQKGMEAARSAGDKESRRQFLSLAATLATLAGDSEKANGYLEEARRLGASADQTGVQEEIPEGGTLRIPLSSTINALEPHGIETVEDEEVLGNVYETLLTIDSSGNLVPSLCEKWEAREEGRSYLLTLREGVKFQDGHSLTAHDVKTSFQISIQKSGREMAPAFTALEGLAAFKEGKTEEVAGIRVHSERMIEFRLSEPLSIYPALLTHLRSGMIRQKPTRESGSPGLVGTGPFLLASHEAEKIVLKRNGLYWKGTPAKLEAIEVRPGLPASMIASELRAGNLDVARDLLPQDLEDLMRDPRFRNGLIEAPKKNTYFVLFNVRCGPVATNPELRRALSGMMRVQDLVWQTLGRFAQPAFCLIPPGMLGHDPGRRRPLVSREEALEILKNAGFAGKVQLKAAAHPLFQDRYRSLLNHLLALWSEIGVEVSIVTSNMTEYLEAQRRNDQIDLLVGRYYADYDDPDNFTHFLFNSSRGQFGPYFSSDESDKLLHEAQVEHRPEAREALYRKFEALILKSNALVPLFHDIDFRLVSPRIKGLQLRQNAPYVNYSALGKMADEGPAEAEAGASASGTLQVPIAGAVTSIDPALAVTVEQNEVTPQVFEPLTRQGGGATIVPWLAKEFRVEERGRRYWFRLRDNVLFHDGRRLTARDVRYTFERLLQTTESAFRTLYAVIRGAKAIISGESKDLAGFHIHSATEFSIDLEEPLSFFPALLAYEGMGILPEGTGELGNSWQAGCVGTGPFRVVKFEPGRRLELERNRHYWRAGFPRTQSLIFTFGASPRDILSEFRAGRYSLCADLFPADVETLRREADFASGYRETPRLATYFVALNRHKEPFADKALRQSFVRSLDVDSLVRRTVGRLGAPAHGFIPPGLLGHETGGVARRPRGGGMATEKPTSEIELTAAINPVYFAGLSALGEGLIQSAAERGFKIKPVTNTVSEYMECQTKGKTDVTLARWIADFPDVDTFATQLHTQRGVLGKFCGASEIDRLIERGRTETVPAVRHSIYREIEEILVEEALMTSLFYEQVYRFARPEIEGLTLSFWGSTVPYETLRIR